MKQAISYIRFSSKKQEQGDSLIRQNTGAQKHCAENDMVLGDLNYQDLGVSAYRGKHRHKGALNDLIRNLESGLIAKDTYLIIESMSRLSREHVREQMAMFLLLLKGGLNLVFLMSEKTILRNGHPDGKNVDDASELMMSLMEMVGSNRESKEKGERVAGAWKRRFIDMRNGKVVKQNLPSWIEVIGGEAGEKGRGWVGGEFKIRKGVKRIAKIAIDLMLNENCGFSLVAKKLNAMNIKPWGAMTAKHWNNQQVKNIFTNSACYGLYTPKKYVGTTRRQKTSESFLYYPPLISKNKFLELQAKVNSRKNNGGGYDRQECNNLFRGYSFCTCGSRLHLHTLHNNNKDYKYLTCSDVTCEARNTPYEPAFNALLVMAWQTDWKAVKEGQSRTMKELLVNNERLNYEIATLNSENVTLLKRWKINKSEAIFTVIDENEKQMKSLKDQIKDVGFKPSEKDFVLSLTEGGDTYKNIDWGNVDIRREALRIFQEYFKGITISTPDINTTLLKGKIEGGDTHYIAVARKGIKSKYRLAWWSSDILQGEKDKYPDYPYDEDEVLQPPKNLTDFWENKACDFFEECREEFCVWDGQEEADLPIAKII